jgi:hypothetical protein
MNDVEEIIRKHRSEMGKLGGRRVVEKYGRAYMSKIGKIAAEKRWGKKKEEVREEE